MAIIPSTREEITACNSLIEDVRRKILGLKESGKRVHFIWDVDSVLTTPRSDDVFAKLGFSVEKYFQYEERLMLEPLEWGVWLETARACGDSNAHDSQDIVTARSSYLLLRVQFLLLKWEIPTRWQLYVGHQSKAESYRIILQSFLKQEDVHVFMVDDGKKHVDAFNNVATELGMSHRCHGILSPQIREYDEEDIRNEIAMVFPPGGLTAPCRVKVLEANYSMRSNITVVPDGPKCLNDMVKAANLEIHKEAIVNGLRDSLEIQAEELFPGRAKTVNLLYYIYEMTIEIAQRQWG